MRYDTPVYFQKVIKGEYDPISGDYEEDLINETRILASIVSTSIQTMNIVYGKIKQGSLTIHIQNHYTEPVDSIRINKKIYRIDNSIKMKNKQSFILSEVQ